MIIRRVCFESLRILYRSLVVITGSTAEWKFRNYLWSKLLRGENSQIFTVLFQFSPCYFQF